MQVRADDARLANVSLKIGTRQPPFFSMQNGGAWLVPYSAKSSAAVWPVGNLPNKCYENG